ncbi:Hypothetical predicted protein [Olea europaea subsp. europaea]|uniref:Uncharacterized protein n=1 Tax=Olea europaea subsp. europaea TaxID=158383 RepID=A0A8S0STZ3_OLEEU|nr:Hypothetical predicted protein [Olea europaea subsp. europaea]
MQENKKFFFILQLLLILTFSYPKLKSEDSRQIPKLEDFWIFSHRETLLFL